MMPGKRRIAFNWKKLAAGLAAFLLLAVGAFWLYVQRQTYPPEAAPLDTIRGEAQLTITKENNHFLLTPRTVDPGRAPVIFYPGGLVAPEAYLYKLGRAALCLDTPVYLIRAPFNAAIFQVNAAAAIMDRYDLERAWVGGHSLGGIAACRFTAANPDRVGGLFLFGSYCDRDIGAFDGPVVSVMGLQDDVINRENYERAKANLPASARIKEIEGLNHSDFGNYGLQKNDGESKLEDAEVIEIICQVFR